jgi:hypothetical protein
MLALWDLAARVEGREERGGTHGDAVAPGQMAWGPFQVSVSVTIHSSHSFH